MGRKKKEDKEKMSFFERQQQTFNSGSTTHDVFVNVTEHQRVKSDTEKGIRVLVARYPDFYKIYFYEYIPTGTPSYPRGGVKVWNATHGQMQCFYYESVALHPAGGRHRFTEVTNGEK